MKGIIFESFDKFVYHINESEMFSNYSKMFPGDFSKFEINYKKLNPSNRVLYDDETDSFYGINKNKKDPHWKYIRRLDRIYHDETNTLVLGLVNMLDKSKNHPWSK